MSEYNLASNTFKVEYCDGTEAIVKPSSWKDLEDIEILQKELIKQLVDKDGAIGSLLKGSNKKFWGTCEKLASLLNVVGEPEKGIDLNKIEDVDQIVRIFITTSQKRHPETGGIYTEAGEPLERSEVCRINGLDFLDLLNEIIEETQTPKRKAKTTTK